MERLMPGTGTARGNLRFSLKWVASIAILIIGAGCGESSENSGGQVASQGLGSGTTAVLLAGKDTPVGSVTAWIEDNHLNVKYSVDSPWTIVSSHLDVKEDWKLIPQTKTHNPIPGHFAHKASHDPASAEYIYRVDLADDFGPMLYIAAHAEVTNSTEPGNSSEGAWAAGTRFTEKGNWATWFALNTRPQIRECLSVPCMPNLARSAVVTVSSTVGRGPNQADPEWAKERAVDGNRESVKGAYGWSSMGHDSEQSTEWIQFDFGTRRYINEVHLYARNDATEGTDLGNGFPRDFIIETSQDGVRWTPVVSRVNYPAPEDELQSFTFPGVQTRLLRVRATRLNMVGDGAYHLQLAEIEIYDNPGEITYTFSSGEQAELSIIDGDVVTNEDAFVAEATELDTLFVEYQSYLNQIDSAKSTPVDGMVSGFSAGVNPREVCVFKFVGCWKRKIIDPRWPNNTVYFEFHRKVSEANRQIIRNLVADWNNRTSVRWVEDTSRFSRVMFKVKKINACGISPVGRTGIPQKIKIHPDCVRQRTVHHEMGHAVGLDHEQQRCDRDSFLTGVPNSGQSKKECSGKYSALGPYDYSSVMHYFEGRGHVPQPLGSVGNGTSPGGWGLSCHDLLGINKLYGVAGGPLPTSPNVLDCNFARIATVSVSSTTGNDPTQPDGRWTSNWAVDGQRNSLVGAYGWSSMVSGNSTTVEWIQFEFPSMRWVSRVDMYPRNDATFGTVVGDGFPVDFTIELSNDGTVWTPVVSRTGYPRPTSVQPFEFTAQPARFVRVRATRLRNVTGGFYFQVAEIEIF